MTFPCEKVSMCEINGAELKKERKKCVKTCGKGKKMGPYENVWLSKNVIGDVWTCNKTCFGG